MNININLELHEDAASSDWTNMFVFYYRRAYFVEEVASVKRVIAPVKMAEFLNGIQLKDDQRLLQNLEREAELRAFEKELFVQKLLRNVPF
nr:hypothetical protein [Tanacetum cinerariifolium]